MNEIENCRLNGMDTVHLGLLIEYLPIVCVLHLTGAMQFMNKIDFARRRLPQNSPSCLFVDSLVINETIFYSLYLQGRYHTFAAT